MELHPCNKKKNDKDQKSIMSLRESALACSLGVFQGYNVFDTQRVFMHLTWSCDFSHDYYGGEGDMIHDMFVWVAVVLCLSGGILVNHTCRLQMYVVHHMYTYAGRTSCDMTSGGGRGRETGQRWRDGFWTSVERRKGSRPSVRQWLRAPSSSSSSSSSQCTAIGAACWL